MLGRPCPHDLGKGGDADAHQFAAFAFLRLLLAQLFVTDHVHRQAQRAAVITAVVLPAQGGFIGEHLRLDEVLHAELSRVHAYRVSHLVSHALDGKDRLGDPEGAAIGDASRRLVGIDAVDFHEGVLEIIRAGADVKQPGGELGRVGGRVCVTVVGDGLEA